MTQRLYYRDSFMREFDARVISCEPAGDRWKVTLDRTGFYPTSGGQPHDTGRLGGVSVVEVEDAENHVVHYTSAEIPEGVVHGEIDWSRRFDHMQQHTGQHLLSAAFIELFKYPTVSFHLGREISTIDLDAPSIVPRHLEEAERRVNELIFEDRPVVVRFGTAEELAEAGIRKKVDREGVLRAIDIEGVDLQPCGGTHLARTGQAGLLLIRKLERTRDRWRIEFVCGFRAMSAARGDFRRLTDAASLLSCGLPDVPAVLNKALEERRSLHSTVKGMEERLAELEAQKLLTRSELGSPGGVRLVSETLAEGSLSYLGLLAAKVVAAGNAVALLASRETGHIVFAQSKGLNGDMGAVLRETVKEFAGKGGGAKDFAQGSIADSGRAEDAIAAAGRMLKRCAA